MDEWEIFEGYFNKAMLGVLNAVQARLIAELLKGIYRRVKEKLFQSAEPQNVEFDENRRKTKVRLSQVRDLIEILEDSDDERTQFLNEFPQWKEPREKVIEKLGNLAHYLHMERKIANCGKIASGSLAFLGVVTTIVSAIFPAAAKLKDAGVLATRVGAGAGLVTIGGETLLLNVHLAKAKKLLVEDEKHFIRNKNWCRHTKRFIRVSKDIFDFRILQIIFKDVRDLLDMAHELSSDELIAKLNLIFDQLCDISVCFMKCKIVAAGILLIFFLIHRRNRILLSAIVDTGNLCLAFAVSSGIEVVNVAGYLIPLEVFACLGLALNAAKVYISCVDLCKGSISEHGEVLKIKKDQLQEELNVFQQIYDELRN